MWKDEIILENTGYNFIDGIYTKGNVSGNENVMIFDKIGGTDFYSRSRVRGTMSFFDTKIIHKKLEKISRDIQFETILDMGCGDGRSTIWFLENTAANVVAIDGAMDSLQRLKRNYLDNNIHYQERTLLIHSNIINVPIKDAYCDLVWSFEVFYYLMHQIDQGIRESARVLKNGGYLVNGERNKEIGMLHELLNTGPSGFIKAYSNAEITENYHGNEVQTSIFYDEQIKDLLREHGFSLIRTTGLSFFPLIVSYLRSRDIYLNEIEDRAEELAEIFCQVSESNCTSRVTIFISQKN